MTIADSFKRFRKGRGLTQQEVAEALDIHKQAWQRYESGKVVPSATFVRDLAEIFSVSTDYLMGLTNNPQRL